MFNTTEARIVPAPVLVEFDWLVSKHNRGVFPAFLKDVEAGAYQIEELQAGDYDRAAEIMNSYADANVGFVDAAVLAIVERLGEPKLATLDRRHFGVMKPRHVLSLQLLPE